jgi:hypothetical protein
MRGSAARRSPPAGCRPRDRPPAGRLRRDGAVFAARYADPFPLYPVPRAGFPPRWSGRSCAWNNLFSGPEPRAGRSGMWIRSCAPGCGIAISLVSSRMLWRAALTPPSAPSRRRQRYPEAAAGASSRFRVYERDGRSPCLRRWTSQSLLPAERLRPLCRRLRLPPKEREL